MAIHEAEGQNVTVMNEVAYSLVTGGGKPGQGYPCVLIVGDSEEILKSDSKQHGHGAHP